MLARRHPRILQLAACLTAVALSASCSSEEKPAERLSADPGAFDVREGLTYWQQGDVVLRLDACLPRDGTSGAATSALPALVILHGGGFSSGDRVGSGSRDMCEIGARNGIASFSIDYRLAPTNTYPDQVDDVEQAIGWLRQPAQVAEFGLDPARIGLLGSSAGAILALSVGTAGSGATDTGTRVKAVVSLSGVADFRPAGTTLGTPEPEAVKLILNYLGCPTVTACPVAAEASPVTQVDATDPPILLVNGTRELVPSQQADAMASALETAGVAHQEMLVDSDAHGTSLLTPDVRQTVASFLKENL